jgi:AcrR family transcriptional regulator
MKETSRKSSARRGSLNRTRILAAALRMADKDGLDTLSMRNLAHALKAKPMSLYNHVASKEELLDGLVELVVGEIEVPTSRGDWKTALRERAVSAHTVLMRHPWATMLFVSRLNVGPNMLRYVDATIGCLRAAGFSYAMADHAWTAVDAYVYGFTLHKLNFPLDPAQYAPAARQFMPLIPAERFPYLNGMSQEVIAGRHDGLHHLAFGLELILDGLERLWTANG